MAEDIKNLRLSLHASDIANEIKDICCFEDAVTVAKFAFAYAVKNYPEELTESNFEKWDNVYDAAGNNYNIGTIDGDKFLYKLIKQLYPDTTTPYRYIRVIMCFGLNKLGDLKDTGSLQPIYAKM